MRLLISTTRDQTDQQPGEKSDGFSLSNYLSIWWSHGMDHIVFIKLYSVWYISKKSVRIHCYSLSLSLLLLICFSSSRVRLWISFSSKNPKVNLSWILLKCGSPLEQLISLWDWTLWYNPLKWLKVANKEPKGKDKHARISNTSVLLRV